MNKEDIQKLQKEILESIASSDNLASLEQLRLKYLSRKGQIALLFEQFKNLDINTKKELGPLLNELKKVTIQSLNNTKSKFADNSQDTF